MNARRLIVAAGLALPMALTPAAWAQLADTGVGDDGIILPDLGESEHEFDERSGLVRNDGEAPAVVWSVLVQVPNAAWIRLKFDDVLLGGTPFAPDQSYLRVTSVLDGAVQTLNQVHVAQWYDTSAYFNGDTVLVELIAAPGTGDNSVAVVGAWAGDAFGTESICGAVDDRVLSDDPRAARYLPAGCTAWIFDDDNSCIGTAGHCVRTNGVIEFNVPLSSPGGSIVHPPPEDQYSIDNSSRQWVNGGVGNDWGYMGAFPNTNTGLTPYEAQGDRYTLADQTPPVQDQTIRITGYGSVSSPVDPRWNLVQKTHTGPHFREQGTTLQYAVDTTGGNSGSPVIHEDAGEVIGVHTHAGCNQIGGNQGTSIEHTGWQDALFAPAGVCAPPPPPPSSELFVAASRIGEIGAVDPDNGEWGVAALTGLSYDGMAYDRNTGAYYITSTSGPVLYRMTEGDWSVSTVGTIQGASRISGLAYDPASDTLYGSNMADGQLYRINTNNAVATPIGSASGNRLAGLAFNEDAGRLYGVTSDPSGSRLLLVEGDTGAQWFIGSLGGNITRAEGLAWRKADGHLYTINSGTLYTVDRNNGQASQVVAVDADLATTFGMAAGSVACPADLNGDGEVNVDDFFTYLDLFAAGDPAADLDGDGDVDVDDFFAYLDLFAQGC